jgi:tRNA(Ile)-lysidine synthase
MDGLPFLKKPTLKPKWSSLEATTYRLLKEHGVEDESILIACSGGLDSMVLLNVLARVRFALRLQLFVGHIHHGPTRDKKQLAFRNRTLKFVEKTARELGLKFGSYKSNQEASSEAGLRDLRIEGLKTLSEKFGTRFTAFAHHEDDLLETRLIRLIRGVGAEGLASMKILNSNKLRPFLEFSRKDLEEYALTGGHRKIAWVDDPSNKDLNPLRNWIRAEWLPSLERKRSGGVHALARSLQNLSSKPSQEWVQGYYNERGVMRVRLLELSHHDQKQVIASYLKQKVHKNYSLAHIEEVLKRVEVPRKLLNFRLLDRDWKVNAEYIEII